MSYESNDEIIDLSREAGGVDFSFELDTIAARKANILREMARLQEELDTIELFGA
ncbi:MAG: hypothetical protein KGI54_13220 [Pseudomonadota bacterium]|nr:hypothetical protein [Pseudomonadota bacterium]